MAPERPATTVARIPPARLSEWVLIARLAAWIFVTWAACAWVVDPDLWGHLRFGLDVIATHSLPTVDPYSFTQDVPWINHEWLSEALMGLAYSVGQVSGLLALKVMIAAGSYWLIAQKLRDVAAPMRWWLLVLAVLTTIPLVKTLRPQLSTVLALTIWGATLDWPLRWRFVVWPALFAIWANLHGGWIVGLGVTGLWSLGQVLDTRDWRQIGPLGLLWIVCLLATLLTPYGTHLWGFMWNTVGMGRAISEWRPVWRQGDVGDAALWSLTALISTALALRLRWSWSSMLPVLLLGGASFQVARLVGFFGLTTVLLLGARWRQAPAPRFPPIVLALATLGCAVAAGVTVGPEARCLPISTSVIPDLVTPGALASPDVRGRLMVPFDWGQYAIWHFGPRLRVSMDGRRETVYSEATLEEQLALDHGDPTIVMFIGKQQPEYVWLARPIGDQIAGLLRERGYRQDVTTAQSTLLVRADQPMVGGRAPMPACFP